jgi:septal ring factor EnvC (AmiA/AmiB activator)
MTQDDSWILFNSVVAGAAKIKATTALATADIPFAQARIDAAVQMTASLATTKAAITAWNPSATYKSSDLVAVKTQLTGIIDQLSTLTAGLNELYTYRKANDQSIIDINNALIWMAKQQLGGQGEGLL